VSVFKKPEPPRVGPASKPIGVASEAQAQSLVPSPLARESGPAPSKRDIAEMQCPECASPDVRKVSLIFESGTKESRGVAVGMTGSNEVGVGVMGGTQQSLLASRLQPPKQVSGDGGRAILAAIGSFLLLFLFSLAASGNGFLLALAFIAPAPAWLWVHNLYAPAAQRAYEAAMTHWQKQWCCMKCGHVFAWVNGDR
jgi:hypothetical protein